MASSSLAAASHHHFFPSRPLPSPKPSLNCPRHLSCALGAAARRTSQAELRPESKNAAALSAELRRLARGGRLPSALSLLDHLSHRGVPATASAFAALLSACRSLPHARQIHAHLRVHGLDSNEFLLARLVELYLALGARDDARRVLDELPRASSFSWNALLHGHVRRGRGEAGAAVSNGFAEMRAAGADANEYTYGCVLKSISGSAAPSMAMATATHAMLIKNAFAGAAGMLMTGLMDVYFKCGKVKPAVRVFEEMPERDVVAWGAVIAGFAHKGMKREALEHFRGMVDDGVKVNSVVLTSVVPVIGELRARKLGREIHAFVLKKFQDRKDVANIQAGLVDMYCKCGDMVSGRRVFYRTKKRNVVSWTALMSGYASNGRPDQALRSMLLSNRRPDAVAISRMLCACSDTRASKLGKELHGQALKLCMESLPLVGAGLVSMYGTCRDLKAAQRVFNRIESKGSLTCTAIIEAYAINQRHKEALDLFAWMLSKRFVPNNATFNVVLRICEAAGLHDEALQIFNSMVQDYNLEASEQNFDCIIRLLTSADRISEARRFSDLKATLFDLSSPSLNCEQQ
ncbi:hypothetical protein GUJ93_ZPchr0012g21051 [Zizania palustris]|uniref:Pentatricopeptide repeat-containing protein n=1 Tax=Zizania palustris TaxID=103762 RepID=A0A8J5WQR7_ZIZPA|nr:hypothetical protein GUJ93_ZPchr0012g21051 [Zizania palustris]